ncbi:MAG: L,D-transpeptidase family protein [Chitinophagaceae bacterium]
MSMKSLIYTFRNKGLRHHLPLLATCYSLLATVSMAQLPQKDFISYQKGFKRVGDAFNKTTDTLRKQFEAKGLKWPSKYMYIRSFKYDSQMEVWFKNEKAEQYKLFKTYKVCALAGTLGPKRMEGDYQVPEGFYYINEFKPNSNYHLALGVSYPNASDRVLSDSLQPGSEIFVHGSCTTVGCIPINNDQIEELYTLAAMVHNEGQDFIPIHVFPVSFKNKKTMEYLTKYLTSNPSYATLLNKLKYAYYYFDLKRNLPVIMVDKMGSYTFADEIKISFEDEPPPVIVKKVTPKKYATQVDFDETTIAKTFYRQAVAPDGMKGFQKFLDEVAVNAAPFLPEGIKRMFVTVEFIVDKTGKVILPKVLTNTTPEMHNMLIEHFEAMPAWTPALDTKDQPVPVKLQQGIEINEILGKKV